MVTIPKVRYAVRKKHAPHEWLIFQPGGRLDHWGPECERAEFWSMDDARSFIRAERAERFAEIIPVGST